MGPWFKQFQALIWAISISIMGLVYVYQAFATKDYVEAKHESVMQVLQDIRQTVITIDQRTYELAKEKK